MPSPRLRHEAQRCARWALKRVHGRTARALRNWLFPYRGGRGVPIWDDVHIDKPSRLVIGDNVSIKRGCIVNAAGGVGGPTIEDDVLIGPNVIIYTQNHEFSSDALTRLSGSVCKRAVIERNGWLAAGIILPGVTVGRDSMVGPGSVATRSIERCTMAGNPARTVRSIGP